MRYYVEIEGREFEVFLQETPEGLEAHIGDRVHHVDFLDVDQLGQYSLIVDQASYAVSLEGVRDRYEVGIAGEAFQAKCEDERERAARALEPGDGAAGQVIEATMPGIVRHLEIKEGDRVAAGDTLLILEAMKMQNEIKAGAAGAIGKVYVAVGETVMAGERLVEVAPDV